MRRLSPAALLLAVGVLSACSAGDAPTDAPDFEGVSTANPRDLPRSGDFAEGDPGPEGGIVFGPVSARVEHGVAYRFSLGHCGLHSPVDVDGSFWDAVDGTTASGEVLDLENDGEMINTTSGVIVVIGDEMRFRTDSGSVVRFARHDGDKEFPACM